MNSIQEKNKSFHVFTSPATSEKPRDNFVSRDNFNHYCTLYLARCTVGSNHSVVEDLNGSATLDSILGCLLHIIYLLESCLLNIIYFFESCLPDSIYLWGRVFHLPGRLLLSVSCLSTWYRYHLSVSKSVYLISSICE